MRILHVQEALIEDIEEAITNWLTRPQGNLTATCETGEKLYCMLDTLLADAQKTESQEEERGETPSPLEELFTLNERVLAAQFTSADFEEEIGLLREALEDTQRILSLHLGQTSTRKDKSESIRQSCDIWGTDSTHQW